MTNETVESILFEVRNRIASESANRYSDQELSAVMDRIEAVVKEERSNGLKASKEVRDICIQRRDKIIASKDAEIMILRTLVKGLLEAATIDCVDCDYDCGQNRENCIVHEAAKYIEGMEVTE